MWIDGATYDDLRLSEATARATALALEREIIAVQTTLDWLRVRTNQMEVERAQMLFTYTGVKVPVPRIEQAKPSGDNLNAVPNFEDLGDAVANQLGISHNPDGTLRYKE